MRTVKSLALGVSFTMLAAAAQAQTTYDIAATGNWTAPATWTPILGPGTTFPGSLDSISITSIPAARIVNLDGAASTAYSIAGLSYNDTDTATFQALASSGAKTLNVSGNLTKANTGILNFLSTTSAVTTLNVGGTVSVTGGTLNLGDTRSMGFNFANTSISSGATVVSTGISGTVAFGQTALNGALTVNRILGTTPIYQFAGLTGSGAIAQGTSAAVSSVATFQFTGTGTNDFSGNITEGANIMAITHSGSGHQKLSGTIATTGTTLITGGVLELGTGFAGTGNINIQGGVLGLNQNLNMTLGTTAGTIQLTGATSGSGFAAYGADRTVTLNSGAGLTWASGTFNPGGATPPNAGLVLGASDSTHKVTVTNAIALGGAARTVTANDGAAIVDGSLTGVISGTQTLRKMGAGALELTGNNTYTGATTVAAGTLLVNNTAGSGTGTNAALNVSAGATLGGNGFVGNSGNTVTTAGTTSVIAMGATTADTSTALFTLNGNLNVAAGATFNFGLGTSSDQLLVLGNFTGSTGASMLLINFADSGGFGGGIFTLIDNSSVPVDFDLSDFMVNTEMAGYSSVLQFSGNDLQVVFTAVPEPSTYAMLGMGMVALWVLRRRSQKV